MRRIFIGVALIFIALLLGVWFGIPWVVKDRLEAELGKRQFSDIVKQAEAENRTALGKIGQADILLDIPTEPLTAALNDELQRAVNLAELGSGWKAAIEGEPQISFHPAAIRAQSRVNLSNDDVGAATVNIQFDVVPSIQGNDLVAAPFVTALSLVTVKVHGFNLPGFVADRINEAIVRSLEALNTKVPQQRIAIELPAELLDKAPAQPALLVVNQAVAALLGTVAPVPKKIEGAYSDEFTKIAKEILPDYVPGAGVVAVRPASTSLLAEAEVMRGEAAALNLATLETMLGTDGTQPPARLAPEAFANLVMVSAEGRYFERQLKEQAIKAIAELDHKDVILDVKPGDIQVALFEGVVEAKASGTAYFADGELAVSFSLTAWAVLRPGPEGLVVSYAPREIKVRSVKATWADRSVSLQVPYETGLGDVVARFIGALPNSFLEIPDLPLDLAAGDQGDFRLMMNQSALALSFTGRAVAIGPARISVFAVPSLDGDVALPASPAPTSGQLPRLIALAARAHETLAGSTDADSLTLAVPKAGFARLLETAWSKFDPAVSLTHRSTDPFGPEEIKVIPGDASCGNPCKDVNQCGDILKCTENICSTVLVDAGCYSWCPGGHWNPICKEICNKVAKEVCHEEKNQGCISRINNCAEEVARCTAMWSSGAQTACEVALAAIKATDTTGLAKVSGGTSLDASAATASGSRLSIAPDLSSLELAIDLSASASADAWLNVTWTDWGNLFACPSGKLAVHLDANARLATPSLNSKIEWEATGEALKATFSFDEVVVVANTAEGPLGKLITSNPGMLACGLGQTFVGLTLLAVPRVTQDLLADAIRLAANESDRAKIAAAMIDGRYTYRGNIPPASFDIPTTEVPIFDRKVMLKPRMTEASFVMGTGALEQ